MLVLAGALAGLAALGSVCYGIALINQTDYARAQRRREDEFKRYARQRKQRWSR